jgi:ribonucleotide monophosphatase NagD (HAD superfamily)
VLIAAFKSVCGKDPIICGKPSHIIVEHVLKHLKNPDPSKVLMIGDRLDTDIAFANKAEFASCLVLSGIVELFCYICSFILFVWLFFFTYALLAVVYVHM